MYTPDPKSPSTNEKVDTGLTHQQFTLYDFLCFNSIMKLTN